MQSNQPIFGFVMICPSELVYFSRECILSREAANVVGLVEASDPETKFSIQTSRLRQEL